MYLEELHDVATLAEGEQIEQTLLQKGGGMHKLQNKEDPQPVQHVFFELLSDLIEAEGIDLGDNSQLNNDLREVLLLDLKGGLFFLPCDLLLPLRHLLV